MLAFNTDGFELGTGGGAMWGRDSGNNKVATWTFRKAEKFFDVVTYTGNGTTQEISHNLGVAPAFIIVKETSTTRDWVCYHSALGETYRIFLNASNAAINSSSAIVWGNNTTAVAPTDSVFTIGNAGVVNESGGTYVAYLFASDAGGFGDDGSESIIKCGTFSMPGTSFADVDVGFEPQWVLLKDYNHTQSWTLIDTMRGLSATTGGANGASGNLARLWANLSYAESPAAQGGLTSTGFTWPSNWNYGDGNTDYIYIAIRRPMKTPESGTEVFSPLTSSSSAGTKLTTGFPIDMQIAHDRTGSLGIVAAVDRLRGVKTTSGAAYTTPALNTVAANPESSDDYSRGWDNEGFEIIGSFAYGSTSTAYWNFKRATGFFDVVAYTGNGVAGRTVAHNLGVVPELMIVKSRGSARQWVTYDSTNGATGRMNLDDNGPWGTGLQYWNNTAPTDSVFTLGTQYDVNQSSIAYVNYLFASVAGVSKVGSYTGNGTTQNIDCGFSAGARFVLIKRTDAAENWHIFDTERGITSGNDPALRLDTTCF